MLPPDEIVTITKVYAELKHSHSHAALMHLGALALTINFVYLGLDHVSKNNKNVLQEVFEKIKEGFFKNFSEAFKITPTVNKIKDEIEKHGLNGHLGKGLNLGKSPNMRQYLYYLGINPPKNHASYTKDMKKEDSRNRPFRYILANFFRESKDVFWIRFFSFLSFLVFIFDVFSPIFGFSLTKEMFEIKIGGWNFDIKTGFQYIAFGVYFINILLICFFSLMGSQLSSLVVYCTQLVDKEELKASIGGIAYLKNSNEADKLKKQVLYDNTSSAPNQPPTSTASPSAPNDT
jgi:hypothetical protein